MIKVQIDEDKALDMLMDRLEYWIKDHDEVSKKIDRELFGQMYEAYLDCGAFESIEFDVMNIVDNDYVNYCQVIEPNENDEQYKKLNKLYDKQGLGDISGEEIDGNFIEAAYKYDGQNYFLIRY